MLAGPLAGISIKMTKKLISSICFLILGFSFSQAQNIEELAFKAFLDSIYTSEYDELKVIFSGYTEPKTPITMPFFDVDELDMKELIQASNEEKEIIIINTTTNKIKLKKNRFLNNRIPRIRVYPHISYDDKFYVYITVYKYLHYVGHHLFEFDKNKNITNTWYVGEII